MAICLHERKPRADPASDFQANAHSTIPSQPCWLVTSLSNRKEWKEKKKSILLTLLPWECHFILLEFVSKIPGRSIRVHTAWSKEYVGVYLGNMSSLKIHPGNVYHINHVWYNSNNGRAPWPLHTATSFLVSKCSACSKGKTRQRHSCIIQRPLPQSPWSSLFMSRPEGSGIWFSAYTEVLSSSNHSVHKQS